MPETPEVYQMRTSINAGINTEMVVEDFTKTVRVFTNRKVADKIVEDKRPLLFSLKAATLFFCSSQNSELALIFEHETKCFAVQISLALGAVLFWAKKEDLYRLFLDLAAKPNTRTNFYITFVDFDKILVC